MTDTADRARVIAALTDLLRTVDQDERDQLASFLATKPTLREIRAYVASRIADMSDRLTRDRVN